MLSTSRALRCVSGSVAFMLLVAGCAGTPNIVNNGVVLSAEQPTKLAGKLEYTNDMFASYYTRHAVALVDMRGFVTHNRNWELPASSLVFGRMELDEDAQEGSYTLNLPLSPPGSLEDVDHDGARDTGVFVATVAYWSDPLTAGDATLRGWPTDLASVVIDGENGDDVVGGTLVVWAPDDQQQFPSGFGDDKQLFTDDDPLMALPAGYSVVSLDKTPFTLDRALQPNVALHESDNAAVKDFSEQSYSQAFEGMFARVREEYAFNGIAGKEPDWDAMYAETLPLVQDAERTKDPKKLYRALHAFVLQFRDGHVSLDGGEAGSDIFQAEYGGGYGVAFRELDDGRGVVTFVKEDGPAAKAGVRDGAEIIAVDGAPLATAIGNVNPPNGPFSTDFGRRIEQARYLLRGPIDKHVTLTYRNPGAAEAEASLKAVDERDSLEATSMSTDPTVAPIEYRMLDSGLGYVRINTNDDDVDLLDELFARALRSFDYNDAPGIIIDLRFNGGGTPLKLAEYLAADPIDLGQLAYYSSATHQFEPEGERDSIEPISDPYHFDKIAVLVGADCYSACEIEAYGFSQLPNAVVVGTTPSAGVEAEVSQGQYHLPEDMWIQVPTGRLTNPDGSLFLEGTGVQPTLRVPVIAEQLEDDDAVLAAAENALLTQQTTNAATQALRSVLDQQ